MMHLILIACWLGILTSISPCPLASNIAAVSFLGRKISNPFLVLSNAVAYTLGRALFYTITGVVLSYFLSSIPLVSDFLQTKMIYIASPLMIVLGLILLDIVKIKFPSFSMSDKTKNKLENKGFIGALLLGFLFASMLCPVSAAFFFSNLMQSGGNPIVLLVYGIGTGLPVLFFAFVLAFFANRLGNYYKSITIFEKYARKLTAIIFIIVGIYYLLKGVL